jgi:hypothetical protein
MNAAVAGDSAAAAAAASATVVLWLLLLIPPATAAGDPACLSTAAARSGVPVDNKTWGRRFSMVATCKVAGLRLGQKSWVKFM